MLQPVTPQRFYSVNDFIADLVAGRFSHTGESVYTLATPVRVKRSGVVGVVSEHSPNDVNRIRVSYFDRTNWIVRHEWFDKEALELLNQTKTATR